MPGLLLSEKRRHWKKARPSEGKGQMSQGWSEPAVFKDGLCSGWNGGGGGGHRETASGGGTRPDACFRRMTPASVLRREYIEGLVLEAVVLQDLVVTRIKT